MFVNKDFSELLQIFETNQVKYMVIGGYAVVQYTEPRFTKDLDVWISTDPTNAVAVYNALREFGAPLENLTPDDFAEDGHFYQMGVPPIRVDVMMGIPGVEFDAAWSRRNTIQFEDISVDFISKSDLILAKRAAGRPQDLIDLNNLERS